MKMKQTYYTRIFWGEAVPTGESVVLCKHYTEQERTEFIRQHGLRKWFAPCKGIHKGFVPIHHTIQEAGAFAEGIMTRQGEMLVNPPWDDELLAICEKLGCELTDLGQVDDMGAQTSYRAGKRAAWAVVDIPRLRDMTPEQLDEVERNLRAGTGS